MKDAVKIVLILSAFGCFLAIYYVTFVTEQMTVDQFIDLAKNGMLTAGTIVIAYLIYRANKDKNKD